MEAYQNLSHSKWDCKYHVIFIPKKSREALFGEVRRNIGPIFRDLAKQKECEIVTGNTQPDHVHMCIFMGIDKLFSYKMNMQFLDTTKMISYRAETSSYPLTHG